MEHYIYNGPIMHFDKCLSNSWHGETMAPSEAKAMNNLTYKAKSFCNLVANAHITLPGKLYLMKGGVD